MEIFILTATGIPFDSEQELFIGAFSSEEKALEARYQDNVDKDKSDVLRFYIHKVMLDGSMVEYDSDDVHY